jgi:hypothetical protein
MAKKKKEVTFEDCVLEARSLQSKLQELYLIKAESEIYSELLVLDQLIRNLSNKITK